LRPEREVALFYLQINSLSRGAGRRATAAAAYRAGERIRDERSRVLHNFSRRRDVQHTEIFLPEHLEARGLSWARNREKLWNAAEHAEKRHNSRVAREYQVMLPAELNPTQRVALARDFARDIAERYNVAVDLAVHEPRPGGDPRNYHAHLLSTTREITPAGLGAKSGLDLSALERRRRALPDHRQEYVNVRERWAVLVNEALREAHVEARVDHRSLAAQGIDREPRPRIPWVHLKIEQRGVRSEIAEQLRAAYRARVQERLQRSAARAAAATPCAPADAARAAGPDPPAPARDVEEIRRQAREAWLRLRPTQADRSEATSREQPGRESAARVSGAEPGVPPTRHPDDDLAL
jgi:ATP-dependent exoDNAse (exonuclease V) alpha subunit